MRLLTLPGQVLLALVIPVAVHIIIIPMRQIPIIRQRADFEGVSVIPMRWHSLDECLVLNIQSDSI